MSNGADGLDFRSRVQPFSASGRASCRGRHSLRVVACTTNAGDRTHGQLESALKPHRQIGPVIWQEAKSGLLPFHP